MKNNDESWKEFWRKNCTVYQENKRAIRNRKIAIVLSIITFSTLVALVIVLKPNISFPDSKSDKTISLSDNLFITAINEMDFNNLSDTINKVETISVSKCFEDFKDSTITKLQILNSLDVITTDKINDFNLFFNKELLNTLRNNNKKFEMN